MADDDVRVPAGWYPDPLGLPQLRWWDNHAWTEHTSDARQPMVATETVAPVRVAYADDEPEFDTGLPYADDDAADFATSGDLTRRERRERERLEEEDAGALAPIEERPAFAEPLLSLEAPERDQVSVEEPSPAMRLADTIPADAPTSEAFELDTRFDDLLGEPTAPRSAFDHVSEAAPFFVPETAPEPVHSQSFGIRYELPPPADEAELPVSTGPAWAIAFMPLLMLLLGMMFLISGLAGRASDLFVVFIIGIPYIAVIGLAIADRSLLKKRGFQHTAHWFWAILTAPAYLIVRLAGVVRETGRGFGPLLAWVAFAALGVASLLLAPGLIIAAAPQTFSAAAEQSVKSDASILGANLAVDCPDVPPQLIGSTFLCAATNENGESFDVSVSLQRANGWIEWRVDNWGIYSMTS